MSVFSLILTWSPINAFVHKIDRSNQPTSEHYPAHSLYTAPQARWLVCQMQTEVLQTSTSLLSKNHTSTGTVDHGGKLLYTKLTEWLDVYSISGSINTSRLSIVYNVWQEAQKIAKFLYSTHSYWPRFGWSQRKFNS